MAEKTIMDLSTLTSVDRAADYLEIADVSDANASKRSNVNNLLDLTSHPVGINDVQTLTNKTLTTPSISSPVLSGTVTGTYTLGGTPTFPSSVVTLTGSQTLTNKTLTSPTISSPTITNPTLTVDTISEYTSTNGVTIDGLNIKDSKLNTNNSVVTANITDANVTNAKLNNSGTFNSSWVWSTWTPTWTNLTVGNGTAAYLYTQIGKTVHFRVIVTFGSTSSISGAVSFTPPVTIKTDYSLRQAIGLTSIEDSGTASFHGVTRISDADTTLLQAGVGTAGGTYLGYSNLSSTIPMTWTTGDQLMITGTYEAP